MKGIRSEGSQWERRAGHSREWGHKKKSMFYLTLHQVSHFQWQELKSRLVNRVPIKMFLFSHLDLLPDGKANCSRPCPIELDERVRWEHPQVCMTEGCNRERRDGKFNRSPDSARVHACVRHSSCPGSRAVISAVFASRCRLIWVKPRVQLINSINSEGSDFCVTASFLIRQGLALAPPPTPGLSIPGALEPFFELYTPFLVRGL